jgi:hypothetical protein
MDCSKPVGHHFIWYDPAPNSYTEQNDPCVWLTWILGIPMSQGEHLHENNTYNKNKPYNTKSIKSLEPFFTIDSYSCLKV